MGDGRTMQIRQILSAADDEHERGGRSSSGLRNVEREIARQWRERHVDADPRPAARDGVEGEVPAEKCDALADTDQAEARVTIVLRIEADAGVGNLQRE